MRSPFPRLAAVALVALVPLAALGAAGALAAAPKPMAGHAMMEFTSGAKLSVIAPTPNTVITGNSVATKFAVTGFKLDSGLAGTKSVPHTGHLHIMLDRALIDMYGTPDAVISLQNVKPGKHTLSVVAASNDHVDDMKGMVAATFVYKPTKPLPEIVAAKSAGKASIAIVSPQPGATVSGSFEFVVNVKNFTLSHDLFGKPNVAGYGHWHANVDSTTEGMMGMATMLGMSGTNSYRVDLKGIAPGKHRFFALLEDNQHAPSIGAGAGVTVTVK